MMQQGFSSWYSPDVMEAVKSWDRKGVGHNLARERREDKMMNKKFPIFGYQLSNTTNLWWIDVYYLVINYMFRRLWPSSG